ncbi:hypothetical protein SCMC78_68430 [Streptomyces sp. CMC78]|uniref:Uncharacterized protein n=1 Tax=Streptomyces sp. CMC78 TaxID=3231512 RepID=A0AB33KPC8_9ACTN
MANQTVGSAGPPVKGRATPRPPAPEAGQERTGRGQPSPSPRALASAIRRLTGA